ncbi:hypothetical protein VTJ83DRAFT_6891 [Remersonia thermophila]|uniref:Transmembrane protein n=1 Tax=Remersonia thermophila TaxID=72144 RepID=A0ABR4D7H6_9PEZI
MFRATLRRLAQATRPRLSAVNDMVAQERPSAFPATSPQPTYQYKLKKVWPPDIKTMTPQQQLRFEKKYKRRLKLATTRPRWDKFIRLAQLFTITSIASYVILGMSWYDVPHPFDPVREKFFNFFGVFTAENRRLSIENSRPSAPPPKKGE